jgi:hypothetical protein
MVLPGGFAPTYNVELLCIDKPNIHKPVLLRALKKRCPAVEPLDGDEESDLLSFVHLDHMVQLKEGAIPAQTFIAVADQPTDLSSLESAFQQSWKFPQAREKCKNCIESVLVTDLMSSPLPYRERLALFQAALASTLEIVPCEGIHWVPTQQVIEPRRYLAEIDNPDVPNFFIGALNVRFFNVSGSEGEMLMDTLGLAALGLPDLQCHFRSLEAKEVARVLHNTALYVFENGDVIEPGHTVEGVSRGQKWRCQHEKALIAPDRVVLDLNPGGAHAGGKRGGAVKSGF